jgi:hypothetical protein
MTFEQFISELRPNIKAEIEKAVSDALSNFEASYAFDLGEDCEIRRVTDCSPGESLLFEWRQDEYGNHVIYKGRTTSLDIGSFEDIVLDAFAKHGWVSIVN